MYMSFHASCKYLRMKWLGQMVGNMFKFKEKEKTYQIVPKVVQFYTLHPLQYFI